ncbi:MAG: RHS repeat-associated core domain-containing protein [Thioploca sp.]|nr:RHS repeat-associated core domain-containing protein [Thioploca sp.]
MLTRIFQRWSILLICLATFSHPVSAAIPWWLGGEPSLDPGRPPLLAIIEPTTSDNIYTTNQDTLDLAGKVASLSSIDRVEWDSFNLEMDDFLDFGQATLTDTDYGTVKDWSQAAIPLQDGHNEITIIAFDSLQRSSMDRLVVVKTTATTEELFDEELAQKIEATACVGDPIDTATGSQLLEQTLLTVQGVLPIRFTVNYNSRLLKSGPVGKGWDHQNFATHLEELPNGDVKIHWSTNRYNLFPKTALGTYQPVHLNCQWDQLVKNADASFTLIRQHRHVYQFDPQGQLLAVGNRQGQFLHLSYDDQERLIKITEPVSGVFLDYTYNSQGLLTTVTDPLGRQAQLDYNDQQQLITLTDAAGQAVHYTYNTWGQILTGTNAEGIQLFSNTYGADHRLIAQADSHNQPLQLRYDTSQPEQIITTVTNRLGATQVYVHNNHYQLLQVQDELGQVTSYTYDELGRRRTATDGNHQTTTFDYDDHGNLTTLTDAAGHQTHFSYDEQQNLVSATNTRSKTIQLNYDTNNNLVRVTDPLNQTTTYHYNEHGQLLTQTSPRQGVTHYEYTQGQLTRLTTPTGITYTLGYDAAGRLITLTAAEHYSATLTYDGMDRLVAITNPLGHTLRMTYNSRNQWLTLTDANGNLTQRRYDGNGNLSSQTNALGQTTHYQYDGADRLIKISDAKGQTTQLSYDAKGRLLSVTNPLGQTQQLNYDAADNLRQQLDALGNTVATLHYDQLNQLQSFTNALQQTTHYDYDDLNRLTQRTDPLQHSTQWQYDDLNRLIASVDALTGESEQHFDADGNRTSLSDPNQNLTNFDWDRDGRLLQETVASGAQHNYTYNAQNLLEQLTNARGQVRHFDYDAAGRLSQVTDPDGTVSYTYDPNGNVLTVTDTNGTISRQYDSLNRVTQSTDTQGNTLRYEYDAVGNLVKLHYPDGRVVNYEYNAAKQLIKVTDWAGRVTQYEYDPNGRLSREIRPNGTQMTRRYGVAGQLLQQVDTDNQGQIISQFDFRYDAAGNLIEEIVTPEVEGEALMPVQMTYTVANQLATYNGQAVRFDADGNLTLGPVLGQMAELQFDSRNRLVQAGGVSYRYDAENQRVGVNGASYVVNSQPVLSQVLVKEENGKETFYVYGLGLLGEESEEGYSSYHFDFRGSTVALTNERGEVVERFGYGPYGELVAGEVSVTPFLFNGRFGVMSDPNGLYFMRARFYSPEIKRFVNRDVLLGEVGEGQSLNRFAYVRGDPVKYTDPFGLDRMCGPGYKAVPIPEQPRISFCNPDRSDINQLICVTAECVMYGAIPFPNWEWLENVSLPRAFGPGVYLCKRPINVAWVPQGVRPYLQHHWIKTRKYEAGMGGQCPVPGQNCADVPYSPTQTKDHSGQSLKINVSCELVPNVDEECVNQLIIPGRPTGNWTLINQCQTFASSVINQCSNNY